MNGSNKPYSESYNNSIILGLCLYFLLPNYLGNILEKSRLEINIYEFEEIRLVILRIWGVMGTFARYRSLML